MRLSHFTIILLLLAIHGRLICQDFNIAKTGLQTFYFNDPQNRNQTSFTSNAPFETFTGVATDIWGKISFDPNDIKNTIKGEIFVSVNSIKTGIEMRDEELKGDGWLESEKYPVISFKLERVKELNILDDNKIKLFIDGSFGCRGKVKVITLNAILTYLSENEITKKRISGDLISVVTDFEINLSDYGIRSVFVPNRVSDKMEISVNIIGTNAKPE